MKSNAISTAVLLGMIIGVAIYSTIKNGIRFLSFLPLFFMPIAANFSKDKKALEKVLKDRNLK